MEVEATSGQTESVVGASELNGEVTPPGSTGSVVDLLRQDFQELENSKEVWIPVVGYEKAGLAVKYRLPTDGKELELPARQAMRDFKDAYSRNLRVATDTILILSEGLYVKPDDVEEYVMLDPEDIGEPVNFDARLAETLGWDIQPTPRNCLKKLFGGNEMAIVAHAEKLNRWLQNTKADLSVEFWQIGQMGEM